MKKLLFTLGFASIFGLYAVAQDAENCKDSPMFPKRMANYKIAECASNFDEVDFVLGPEQNEKKEGKKSMTRYDFSSETAAKPSALEILKNYEAAVKNIGGTTLYKSAADGVATFKIMKNGKESAWIKVECGGSDNSDFYVVTVLQLEEMVQQVTSDDILNALNKDGHIALYINFETGKADIKPESQVVVDQVATMLRTNPALKINIEGHTDNVGSAASNLTLSENRAKAVMNYLTGKNISAARLSAKGFGQTKPIADNSTEDGKAKNRRVEIVKQP